MCEALQLMGQQRRVGGDDDDDGATFREIGRDEGVRFRRRYFAADRDAGDA
jgi:hypothetical protein